MLIQNLSKLTNFTKDKKSMSPLYKYLKIFNFLNSSSSMKKERMTLEGLLVPQIKSLICYYIKLNYLIRVMRNYFRYIFFFILTQKS